MATREKGRKKTKLEAPQEASQQFTVTDPISMADLENIHTEGESTLVIPLRSDQRLGNWPERKRRKSCSKKEGQDP